MGIVRRMGQFVQRITPGLRVSDQRFVRESVQGLVEGGSTMLTEIGRTLKEPVKLKQTGKRLSRMAKTPHFDDERLRSNYLAEVGPLTAKRLPMVAVDLSEIAKPQGKAMEALCLVRDGSSLRERLTGGPRRSEHGPPQAHDAALLARPGERRRGCPVPARLPPPLERGNLPDMVPP